MLSLNRKERRKAAAQARDRRIASTTAKHMGRANKQLSVAQGEHKLAVFWSRVI